MDQPDDRLDKLNCKLILHNHACACTIHYCPATRLARHTDPHLSSSAMSRHGLSHAVVDSEDEYKLDAMESDYNDIDDAHTDVNGRVEAAVAAPKRKRSSTAAL